MFTLLRGLVWLGLVLASAGPARAEPAPERAAASLVAELRAMLGFHDRDAATDTVCAPKRTRRSDIRVVIATVPDPSRPTLALAFDSAVAALVASAEAAGFSRSGSRWGGSQEKDAGAHEMRSPGAIAFRGGSTDLAGQYLLILLVPESPLTGLDLALFETAWQAARALGARYPPDVVGPYFTGSANKLFGALERERERDRECNGAAAAGAWEPWVVTGSATGNFEPPSGLATRFERTVVRDDEMLTFVRTQLAREEGKDAPSIAVLSDDSAYGSLEQQTISPLPTDSMSSRQDGGVGEDGGASAGQQLAPGLDAGADRMSRSEPKASPDRAAPSPPVDRPQTVNETMPRYRFALGIAQLRAARAAEEAKQESNGTSNDTLPSLRHTLRLRFSEPIQVDADSIPARSQLNPFTTELSLRAVLQDIARRNFEYLLIVASNVEDLVFLAAEARLYCPRVRLLAFGAHSLLTHPDLAADLSGMLVGSSYPLVLEGQRVESSRALRMFESDGAQGVYNALQRVLGLRYADSLSPQMLDYDSGDGGVPGRPWMWLSEVHNGRFWPLRCSHDVDAGPSGCSAPVGTSGWNGARPEPGAFQTLLRPTDLLLGCTFLWLLLAIVQVSVALVGAERPDVLVGVPVLRLFTLPRGTADDAALYRACAHFVHGLFGLSLLLSVRESSLDAPQVRSAVLDVGCAAAGMLVTLGAFDLGRACYVVFRALLERRALAHDRLFRRLAIYTALVALALASWIGALVALALVAHEELARTLRAPDVLLRMRLADPLGMSALTPVMIVCVGLHAWALLALARVQAIARFPVHWPVARRPQTLLSVRLSEGFAYLNAMWRARVWAYESAVILPFLTVGCYVYRHLHPTFEWPGYDRLLKLLLVTLASTVVFACLHATVLWSSLRRLLALWAAEPMVDAYDRVSRRVAGTFGLYLRSHVPSSDELRSAAEACSALACQAREIPAVLAAPEVAAPRGGGRPVQGSTARSVLDDAGERHRMKQLFSKAATDLQARSRALGSLFDAQLAVPLSDASAPDHAREIHAQLAETATELSTVLDRAASIRAAFPAVPNDSPLIQADKLVAGELAAHPTWALIRLWDIPTLRVWSRAAEDFVAMRNATFAYHVIDQIKRCLAAALVGALCLFFATFSYPLHPPRFVHVASGFLLVVAAASALQVIVQMARNDLLSRLAKTAQSHPMLSAQFLTQLVIYVGGPLALLLARAFPGLSELLSRTLAPLSSLLQ